MKGKTPFSINISESLDGRDTSAAQETTTSASDTSPTDIVNSTYKTKKKVGRKRIAENKKKKQMVLTISSDTYNKLIKWAENKARSAPNYVSDYVEEHINDIIK